MYSNIRGIKSKKNSLIEILDDCDPHILLLAETQLRSNVGMAINGYTFFGRKREAMNGGGVGILLRNDLLHRSAPHITDRNIEIMWISVRMKCEKPLIIGIYYGRQESRTSKQEIEIEMSLLQEEINEMKKDGHILLAMDGNAHINLLSEGVNRNGRLLLNVFQETHLHLLNGTEICHGAITRQHTTNLNEVSAIDFIVADSNVLPLVGRMLIDEEGLYKLKGKHETDHNTICVEIDTEKISRSKTVKKTDWNLRASNDKWLQFGNELEQGAGNARRILQNRDIPFENRYNGWFNQLNGAAMRTIGKTTFKEGGKEKFSNTVKDLRRQKTHIKECIKNAQNYEIRQTHVREHKEIQDQINDQINEEKKEIMRNKLQIMASDKSKRLFWKEKKRMARDPVLQQLTIKDEKGIRQFEPEAIKYHTAHYYSSLYKKKPFHPRPYHQEVSTALTLYENDTEHEDLVYNLVPTEAEVMEAVNGKSNGKSTTDVKNEMLKRPGTQMLKFIYPLIQQIWEEEKIPTVWNEGHITSLYKGRGDKEKLENHRGITTSSAIGSIMEILIDNRLEAHLPFTQAQGGGQRGASTCDHLFLLRTIIDVAKMEKRPLFITFYDVSKAYDNVDNRDMLKIVWDEGIRGKLWRLLKNMNSDLKARVKTKYGLTEEIEMEIGGRQGSRNTGRLFSKLMDMLAKESLDGDKGFNVFENLVIPMLLWVDDVTTFANGHTEQLKILDRIDQFAKDHKIRWGREKCQVMRVGKHGSDNSNEWKIGEMPINETEAYKYLGDIVTNDGKNKKNLEARQNKATTSTISIKTLASNEMFKEVGTAVLLELHETVTLSALLTNSESWALNKGEKDMIEKIEIQAIKQLFDLPAHTPTPALIYTFGLTYTSLRVEKRQLIYLWKILNRDSQHWTHKALTQVVAKNIGWGKSILSTLTKHKLPTELATIKRQGKYEWKRKVNEAIEIANKERLSNDLHKSENGAVIPKTKTARIVEAVKDPAFKCIPQTIVKSLTKHETKTLVISRFHMLECGINYKGNRPDRCVSCDVIDDENHRLNDCTLYRDINRCDSDVKFDFNDVYSEDLSVLRHIFDEITNVWNLRNANGTMNN